jgi:hypothetical protein
MRHVLLLLLPMLALAADPVTWQRAEDGTVSYLTIADGRLCLQRADGTVISAKRLVPDGAAAACYVHGRPDGSRLLQEGPSVTLLAPGGERSVFTACPTPPEAIGWRPYDLPEVQPEESRRREVADELARRSARMQGLNGQAAVTQAELQAADEDDVRWLLATLRRDGWISRETYGDQAHEALLLLSQRNLQHLRFAATVLVQLRGELQRGLIREIALAGLADRLSLLLCEPMAYGLRTTVDAGGRLIIPVIAETKRLDDNRARLGIGSLTSGEGQRGARILRIGADGRLVGEGAVLARGLDSVSRRRAVRDPVWGLEAVAKADPALGAAIAAARTGDRAPLAAWTRAAAPSHLDLVGQILLAHGAELGEENGAVVLGLRPLFDGMLEGLPPTAGALQVSMANHLAYALVARATPPTAEELARAGVLGDGLELAVQRPEVAHGPNGHGVADTVACLRFLQGDRAKAAALWRTAIQLNGWSGSTLYHRRLAAAEDPAAGPALPR